MNRNALAMTAMTALLALAAMPAAVKAQQAAPDTVLTNGKIITVDGRFSIEIGRAHV